MPQIRLGPVVLALLLSVSVPMQAAAAEHQEETPVVIFVCEHGSVKSLLAKLMFDQAAAREGLAVASVSRGTAPDAEVPEWMRAALEREGFQIGAWRPTALSESDVRSADLVVSFDVPLPSASDAEVERWDGLPAVSKDYVAGREAIAAHVDRLVAKLKRTTRVESVE